MPMTRARPVTPVFLDRGLGRNGTRCELGRSATTRRLSQVRPLPRAQAMRSHCGCRAEINRQTHRLPNHRLAVGPSQQESHCRFARSRRWLVARMSITHATLCRASVGHRSARLETEARAVPAAVPQNQSADCRTFPATQLPSNRPL
jgi:hypothetical protein